MEDDALGATLAQASDLPARVALPAEVRGAGDLPLVDAAHYEILAEHARGGLGRIVQLTADGRLLTAALDGHVRLWRLPGMAQELDLDLSKHEGTVWGQLSPDGAQLAESNDDGTLGVWDMAKRAWFGGPGGEALLKTNSGPYVYFSPDSKRAYTAAGDGGVRIYDTATWAAPEVLESFEGTASQLALTRDGKTMAIGYSDGAIVIWDLVARKIRTRVGGGTRDHGSCADLVTAAWVDSAQRDLVDAACELPARTYADGLAARSHQRLDDADLGARWDWEPAPPPPATRDPVRAQP